MPSADALLKNKDRFKNIKQIEFNTKKSKDTAIRKYAEESRQADRKNNSRSSNKQNIYSKNEHLDSNQTAKHGLYRQQTSKKLETNLRQTQDKLETNLRQTNGDNLIKKDKLETQLETSSETNLRQMQDKPKTNMRQNHSVYELVGIQKNIMLFIFTTCFRTGSTTTPPLTIQSIAYSIKSNSNSIRKTIQRLEKTGLIKRHKFKQGRGGWTQYKLDQFVYSDLLNISQTQDKLETNLRQNQDKLETQLETQLETSRPSSSSSSYNISKELTTNEYPFNPADVPGQQQLGPQFDSDWQNIDITPLQTIGFTNNHLSQLFTKNELTPKQVQESINAFAFDLEENKRGEKIKTSPLNLFMGILKGGNPYNPPKNYESDEDRILREQVEAEREKLEKRQQLQSELKDLKYQNWLLDLSIEKKLDILDVPQAFFEKMPIEAINEGLRKHFEMKVL